METNTLERYFLKRSIERFLQDLTKMSNIIPDKIFSDDELLELMGDLVGIKENIEALEIIYLEESANDY